MRRSMPLLHTTNITVQKETKRAIPPSDRSKTQRPAKKSTIIYTEKYKTGKTGEATNRKMTRVHGLEYCLNIHATQGGLKTQKQFLLKH